MKKTMQILSAALMFATPVSANGALSEYLWQKRPIVVFADSEFDPLFVEQMELLEAGLAELEERDVVILTDTDTSETSELRRELRPRGFAIVLVGKDGGVKLRKASPWDVRELSRNIDKMPIRQQELRAAGAVR
ncbi:MAG: DUF4174 domain-containing protein [Pseudomonadota bacterium]